jgi:hypothetical protein
MAGTAGGHLDEQFLHRLGQAEDGIDGVVVAVVVSAPQPAVADLHGLGPVLCIDHGDAPGSNDEMVNVGTGTAGPAPVVQHPPPLVSKGLQRCRSQRLRQLCGLVIPAPAV